MIPMNPSYGIFFYPINSKGKKKASESVSDVSLHPFFSSGPRTVKHDPVHECGGLDPTLPAERRTRCEVLVVHGGAGRERERERARARTRAAHGGVPHRGSQGLTCAKQGRGGLCSLLCLLPQPCALSHNSSEPPARHHAPLAQTPATSHQPPAAMRRAPNLWGRKNHSLFDTNLKMRQDMGECALARGERRATFGLGVGTTEGVNGAPT